MVLWRRCCSNGARRQRRWEGSGHGQRLRRLWGTDGATWRGRGGWNRRGLGRNERRGQDSRRRRAGLGCARLGRTGVRQGQSDGWAQRDRAAPVVLLELAGAEARWF
ncbi:hypothetical protein M0R45_001934 [Rubus argutus]|uniref:Uncharacterized protein n=1 Tax=Rubus argutus TaxID=59490 RepID=A0AAW1VI02_RUBAR